MINLTSLHPAAKLTASLATSSAIIQGAFSRLIFAMDETTVEMDLTKTLVYMLAVHRLLNASLCSGSVPMLRTGKMYFLFLFSN